MQIVVEDVSIIWFQGVTFHHVLLPSKRLENAAVCNECSVGAEKVAIDFIRIYGYNYIRMEVQKKSKSFVIEKGNAL